MTMIATDTLTAEIIAAVVLTVVAVSVAYSQIALYYYSQPFHRRNLWQRFKNMHNKSAVAFCLFFGFFTACAGLGIALFGNPHDFVIAIVGAMASGLYFRYARMFARRP